MAPREWSAKRDRQYKHVRDSAKQRGMNKDEAEELAARTVNKERARHGESKSASKSSTDDISSGRRGGLRSHSGAQGPTKDQLYAEAKRRGVKGRSRMNKKDLAKALGR
ncbi:plasmid stabilization protein [Demequina sp.]|uniref:plasmid stabilization protein n=1 Tax=Demequina sp. TaxID=2050685 RepID=UPI003A875BD2